MLFFIAPPFQRYWEVEDYQKKYKVGHRSDLQTSLKVIGNDMVRLSAYDFLLAFNSNYIWLYLTSFLRHNEILVENRKFLVPLYGAPVESDPIEISQSGLFVN